MAYVLAHKIYRATHGSSRAACSPEEATGDIIRMWSSMALSLSPSYLKAAVVSLCIKKNNPK